MVGHPMRNLAAALLAAALLPPARSAVPRARRRRRRPAISTEPTIRRRPSAGRTWTAPAWLALVAGIASPAHVAVESEHVYGTNDADDTVGRRSTGSLSLAQAGGG